MRDFLTWRPTQPGNFVRSAPSLVVIILLSVSLLLCPFSKIYASSGPVHAVNAITDCAKMMDTIRPVSGAFPGKVSEDDFRKKALAKIKQFEGCLYILCDISSGNVAQDNAIDQAISLFVDGAIIEVSTVHSNIKKHLKVRDFLEKLRNLPYDGIKITFSHVDYVSNIRKGADGKYYGLVSFEQTFRAYRDGHMVYTDETKKTAEVQLVVYEKNLHGNAIRQWDVMLSDVEVLGTKNPKP
ncbi:MAG TPA: hypothetical protein VGH64_07650 [Puia sp.]